MGTIQDYIAAVGTLVPGTLPLGDPEKIKAVTRALSTHSRYRPRRIVEDVPGAGGSDYDVILCGFWEEGFSRVLQVEYPVPASGVAELLEDEDWQIYDTPAGRVLRFLAHVPSVGQTFRVTYTIPHRCDLEGACSVAPADEEAVHALAAAYYCEMLATYFAQDQDSTIAADSVDHTSKTKAYSSRAKAYRARYNEHMGIQGDAPPPVSMNQDQDVVYPIGWDRLTHPRKRR